MTRVLLAVSDVRLADRLARLCDESEEIEVVATLRDPQDLRSGPPRRDVEAIVLQDRRGVQPLLELTRELTMAFPHLGLVLIVADDSPEQLRSGMQAGARDVIAEPIGLDQLEASVSAAAGWSQAVRRRTAQDADGELLGVGRVVTVVGSKGGVGTTTIAVNLALAARQLGGDTSVCLVEYDLQAGDLRSFMDLPYRRSVLDLAGVADEITTRHLHETLYPHPSGIRVLLAPHEGEQADAVKPPAARNILTAIRAREDLTIVDAGSTMSDAGLMAAEIADTVIVVATPDVVSLRGVTRLHALWERLRIEPNEIVTLLNRTSRKLEVQPDLVRRVVPTPVLSTTIPADFAALEPSVNAGVPAGERVLRPLAAVLGEISALPRPAAETPDATRSLVTRLTGESGQATVELVGLIPVIALIAVAAWQIVLLAMTFSFAGDGARAGARALAVGAPVKTAAVQDIPGAWRSGLKVGSATGSIATSASVKVTVDTPVLIPGLLDIHLPISARAGTVIEDRPLPWERTSLSFTTATAGGNAVLGGQLLSTLQYVPGNQAVLEPDGTAEAPADAPLAVKEMIAAANEINHYPYVWGGGHSGSLSQLQSGYDCSGATSFVLYAAHLLASAEVSGDLESYGDGGAGKWVTVYANGDHAHIVIAGLNFDTWAGEGQPPNPPPSGPRWTTTLQDPQSFVPRHPSGL